MKLWRLEIALKSWKLYFFHPNIRDLGIQKILFKLRFLPKVLHGAGEFNVK